MGVGVRSWGQVLPQQVKTAVAGARPRGRRTDPEDDGQDLTPRTVTSEVFYDLSVRREPAVFKDPQTASTRIYVNDNGRDLLERLAAEAGLTGSECGTPRDY